MNGIMFVVKDHINGKAREIVKWLEGDKNDHLLTVGANKQLTGPEYPEFDVKALIAIEDDIYSFLALNKYGDKLKYDIVVVLDNNGFSIVQFNDVPIGLEDKMFYEN